MVMFKLLFMMPSLWAERGGAIERGGIEFGGCARVWRRGGLPWTGDQQRHQQRNQKTQAEPAFEILHFHLLECAGLDEIKPSVSGLQTNVDSEPDLL